MAQKFFLFKRKDPAVSGGAVFSDNGKGISVISFPSSNLAYMAASRGAVTMYFNDSAPFEENSLTLDGESFEKTSVTVSCESGKEADLMEDIINFINRDTAKNVMKFDATGAENTFGLKTAKPTIDARVRARPVERGLVGTDAIITGLDANAVVNGIDFLTTDNLPYVDYEINDINLGVGNLIVLNTGSSYTVPNGVGGGFTADHSGDYPALLKAPDKICSKRTLEFNTPGSLVVGENITSGIVDNISGANLVDDIGIVISTGIVRDGSSVPIGLDDGGIPVAQRPMFTVSTDASANITDFRCTYPGVNIQIGDVVTVTFSSGTVVLTVSGVHFPSEIDRSEMIFLSQVEAVAQLNPALPHEDYTLFCVFVRPTRALLDPVYTHFGRSNRTSTFSECMGPFPYRSLGNQFQFNHNDPSAADNGLNAPKKEAFSIEASEPFSDYVRSLDAIESSKDNLECIVVRRTKTGAMYVYDNSGEQVGYQPPSVDPDGVIVTGSFGLPLPFKYNSPTLRIARFGAIAKDIGDLACRNVATQLFNRFKVPLDE